MKAQVRPAERVPAGAVLPLFFAIVFGGAIVLGPLLYFALHPLRPIPFHRAMDRALLVSALAALFFFRSRFHLAQWWPFGSRAILQLALGYFVAFFSVQAMIGLDLVFRGFVSAHLGAPQIAARFLMALVAAIIVPPLEETIFRGFILGELVRPLGAKGACVVSALVYMLAHFLKIPDSLDGQAVHLWSGAGAVGAAFLPLAHGAFLGGRGLNLFLIGLMLGYVFLRSGALWIGIGLHGGWILALLLVTGLTRPLVPPRVAWLGGGDMLSSPVTSLVLIAVGLWLWRFYPPPSDPSEPGASAP